ncbi:MAG: hypothetical protein LUQ65_09800 [Candidatus Helarchaeota archaeon]|nr:hypothetical protein [Candidatus Helarchaeota archaeon]
MSDKEKKKKQYGPYSPDEISAVRKVVKKEDPNRPRHDEPWLKREKAMLERDQKYEKDPEKIKLEKGETWLSKEDKMLDAYDPEKKEWHEQWEEFEGKPRDKKKKKPSSEEGWDVMDSF